MRTSLFSFAKNAISLGYPVVEAIYNLLPLANEVVLVDCGSTDGTKELFESLTVNENIKVYYDTWVNGTGGRAVNASGNLCNTLCKNDIIIFVEADEVWDEELVKTAKSCLEAGFKHLKVWRFQLTQNFQRSSWYPEQDQCLARIFPRGTCSIVEANTDQVHLATPILPHNGYVVDCRNNFRDSYIKRDAALKEVYGDDNSIIRMVPAHSNYSWNMTPEQVAKELQDQRWTWTTTPFRIPKILQWHVGRTLYEVRQNLVDEIKAWKPSK